MSGNENDLQTKLLALRSLQKRNLITETQYVTFVLQLIGVKIIE